jgi:hypothetical protein
LSVLLSLLSLLLFAPPLVLAHLWFGHIVLTSPEQDTYCVGFFKADAPDRDECCSARELLQLAGFAGRSAVQVQCSVTKACPELLVWLKLVVSHCTKPGKQESELRYKLLSDTLNNGQFCSTSLG